MSESVTFPAVTNQPEPQIGNWVKRKGAFRRHVDEDGTERWTGPRWHVVESTVADRAVVRCGKEMHRLAYGGELEVSALMPLTRLIGQPQLCHGGCDRQNATVNDVVAAFPPSEDDASTAPTDAVDVP